jgi:hypothetical protein
LQIDGQVHAIAIQDPLRRDMALQEPEIFKLMTRMFHLPHTQIKHIGNPRRFAVAMRATLPATVIQGCISETERGPGPNRLILRG